MVINYSDQILRIRFGLKSKTDHLLRIGKLSLDVKHLRFSMPKLLS